MDFNNLIFQKAETSPNGSVKITYLQKANVTRKHIWNVSPQADLESYDFEIPKFEQSLIDTARTLCASGRIKPGIEPEL